MHIWGGPVEGHILSGVSLFITQTPWPPWLESSDSACVGSIPRQPPTRTPPRSGSSWNSGLLHFLQAPQVPPSACDSPGTTESCLFSLSYHPQQDWPDPSVSSVTAAAQLSHRSACLCLRRAIGSCPSPCLIRPCVLLQLDSLTHLFGQVSCPFSYLLF